MKCRYCKSEKVQVTEFVGDKLLLKCLNCGKAGQAIDYAASPDELELEGKTPIPEKIYKELCELYKWCLVCGSPGSLENHHIVFRSQSGPTTLENLIRLCADCHGCAHGLVVAGKEPLFIRRQDDGELIVIERQSGKSREIDERPHVPSEADGEAAHALHIVIVSTKREIERNGLLLGEALKDMRDFEAYKVLGYDTFNAYLDSPEVSLMRSQAYKLISICGHAERLQLPTSSLLDVDKDKLMMVLPTAATPEEAIEKVEEARTMSRSDLRTLYGDEDGNTMPVGQHEHPCQFCGKVNRYPGR